MKVIPFKVEHVELAEITGHDLHFCTEESWQELAAHLSGTFIVDGRIVAFAGIVVKGTIGDVWLIPTKYLSKHFISLSRSMRSYVNNLAETYHLTELRTAGHNDPLITHWLDWLGFTYQSDHNYYTKVA